MSDLDDELRRWAREQTDNAPQVHADAEQFTANRRRPWLAPIAAAAAVLVVAGGVLAIDPWKSDSPASPQADHPTGSSTERSVPLSATMRESVFHGLAIYVPESWPDNATFCGTPKRDTLIYPSGATAACLAVRPAGVTSVEWADAGEYQDPPSDARKTEIRIGTVRGSRTVGLLRTQQHTSAPRLHVLRIAVPSRSAQVTIISPTATVANKLAATLQVVTQDENGCAVRNSVHTLADVPAATRPGTDRTLIPGTPTRIALCWYEHGFLEHGASLGAHGSDGFTRLINGLSSGLSIADPKSYLPADCQPDNQFSELKNYDIYVFHVQYATGKPLAVVSRLGTCGRLGVTNGRRNGQYELDLWDFLIRHVGGPASVPGKTLPVR